MSNKEQVVQEILGAFERRPRPAGLVLPEDEWQSTGEMDEVLGERDWWDVDVGCLADSGIWIASLSWEAQLYYLPAFLLSFIWEYVDPAAVKSYLHAEPWREGDPRFRKSRSERLRNALCDKERKAVLALINYCYTHQPEDFQYEYREETLKLWGD